MNYFKAILVILVALIIGYTLSNVIYNDSDKNETGGVVSDVDFERNVDKYSSIDESLKSLVIEKENNRDETLENDTSIPNIVVEKSVENEALSEKPFEIESKLVASNGMLMIDQLNTLVTDNEAFRESQNQLLQDSYYSSISIENKANYEGLLTAQEEYTSGEVILDRLECGERVCLASVVVVNEDILENFIQKIQSSKSKPIKSLMYDINEEGARLVFSAGAESSGFIFLPKSSE